MALFDRTAKHLAAGPTVVLPESRAKDVAELLERYDPSLVRREDRFVCHNGVLLYGPVPADEAGSVGYYARAGAMPKREERPEQAKLLDGERLVRGLALRYGGTMRSERPWAELGLEISVYAERAVSAEQVISVLQPFAGNAGGQVLTVDEQEKVEGSYLLVSEEEPVFLTVFWPGYLSRSRQARPPLALGTLRDAQPCRWQLRTTQDIATAEPRLCQLITEAALALAKVTDGVVVDLYGFPVDRADELPAE
ncbi:MAG TPA: hypothetical protein VHX38_13280 [Pseudonocardiaceae bacterium]|jgi:hypothetical protein|nr:hypothetical protein [Pseudonocardiaceae bacterium]